LTAQPDRSGTTGAAGRLPAGTSGWNAPEPRLNRSIPVVLLAVMILAGLPAIAQAEDGTGKTPQAETAPKPAADTRDPGRTATEAVTHPSAVPPTEGAVGTGKPPATGASPGTSR
jgi:hypothetical protein